MAKKQISHADLTRGAASAKERLSGKPRREYISLKG